ncbi:MAG: hemolysin III family protein [Lachnospiraceae bacterium]|nr:hemolysin III family protein [Lachnospiraceae bacterium]
MAREILLQEAKKLGLGFGVFKAKDPISALTHFIGFLLAIFAMPLLLIRAALAGAGLAPLISLSVFILSAAMLYGASAAYHTFDISDKANLVLRRLDHMMIFILIAGSYTPVCTIALGASGMRLLATVWIIAALGIVLMSFWLQAPKWVSSLLYISMGWACIGAIPRLFATLPAGAFAWLLTGGILYTVGGVIYALKLPILKKYADTFGAHELFHCFVLAGTFCHYMMMLLYLTKMGG